ncbi:major facilitator superfamily domain-containing protein [Aspergillus novoparasiticus]|uniref:Major facilitator superfamily domain-containing protein n=1 Tax=Aspergillus novoparasiticus TaxID=986946 RepID=A0A5N6E6V1_9EURO|nr:major facilitator superfamily domain-containing protein [Aspergillus novoparasiticus]
MSAQPPSLQDNHRLQVVVAALFLALFLAAIDQTIVRTVAPTLATDTRYIDLWTVTFVPMIGVFRILYSHLHSLFSIKIVYLLAIRLFELGSVIYTTAPNSITMMLGRAIAGAGAAGICTGGIEIIKKIIPPDYFLSCIGIMLAILSFAPVVGIFIGSAFTDRSIWQWSVYVNLPLGSLIMYYLGMCIPC